MQRRDLKQAWLPAVEAACMKASDVMRTMVHLRNSYCGALSQAHFAPGTASINCRVVAAGGFRVAAVGHSSSHLALSDAAAPCTAAITATAHLAGGTISNHQSAPHAGGAIHGHNMGIMLSDLCITHRAAVAVAAMQASRFPAAQSLLQTTHLGPVAASWWQEGVLLQSAHRVMDGFGRITVALRHCGTGRPGVLVYADK